MIRRVVGIYFSPVGGTARMTEALASELASGLDECCPEHVTCECHDLLRMDGKLALDEETIAVVGMPVYVGKVPLPAVRMLRKVSPGGAVTVAAVSYGGRTYGNALYELQHRAEEQGFKVVGAGAFAVKYRKARGNAKSVGFSRKGGSKRENNVDMESLRAFSSAATGKIKRLAGCEIEGLRIKPAPLEVRGRLPFHGVSRISPRAAAAAQEILEKLSIRHRESEWYL